MVDQPLFYHDIYYSFVRLWAILGGSGAIAASARDMAQYVRFHLGRGKSETGEEIIPAAMLDELHSPVVTAPAQDYRRPEFPVSYTFSQYALGWRTGDYRGIGV